MTVTTLAQANWDRLGPSLAEAIVDTLIMVSTTLIISGILGLGLGMLLYTTRTGGILQNRFVYFIVNLLVNFVRPIPFIILLAFAQPLTVMVMGGSIGRGPATFVMVIAATFSVARVVEQNLVSIDPGVIEAARSMGASPWKIITSVIVPEALGPLILGYTFLFIAIVDMSAMAGYVGGGGLGDFAIVYGYRAFEWEVTVVATLIIIVLVQAALFCPPWLPPPARRRPPVLAAAASAQPPPPPAPRRPLRWPGLSSAHRRTRRPHLLPRAPRAPRASAGRQRG